MWGIGSLDWIILCARVGRWILGGDYWEDFTSGSNTVLIKEWFICVKINGIMIIIFGKSFTWDISVQFWFSWKQKIGIEKFYV